MPSLPGMSPQAANSFLKINETGNQILDSLELAQAGGLSPDAQTGLIRVIRTLCTQLVGEAFAVPAQIGSAVLVENPPMAYILFAMSLEIQKAAATKAEGACSAAAVGDVNLLNSALNNLTKMVRSFEVKNLQLNDGQTQQLYAIQAASDAGNITETIVLANQLIIDANFTGLSDVNNVISYHDSETNIIYGNNFVVRAEQLFTNSTSQVTIYDQSGIQNRRGLYIPGNGDGASVDDVLKTVIDGIGSTGVNVNYDESVLGRINNVFVDTNFSVGGLLHVPIGSGIQVPIGSGSADASILPLPVDETYVLDPSSGMIYTVGSSLDGHDSGALIIDTPEFGGYATFAAGTYSGVGLEANGNVDVALITPTGDPLGTLSFNPSTGAGTLTLSQSAGNGLISPTGLNINIPGGITINVVDPTETPEQVLLNYLGDLGYNLTSAQLQDDNFNYLSPSATGFSLEPNSPSATDDNTAANVYYVTGTPGAIITGQSSALISYYDSGTGQTVQATVPATNYFSPTNADISRDQITGVQILRLYGALTLTTAEFDDFTQIQGAGTLIASTPGTIDISAGKLGIGSTVGGLSATAYGETTLIGDNENGQSLYASSLGNDVLIAGNGAGDVLWAGGGNDTLTGGAGGDTFYLGRGTDSVNGGSGNDTFALNGTPGAGTTIVGGGGSDTLESVSGYNDQNDITSVTVSGVQTLSGNFTLTAAQFEQFTNIIGGQSIKDTAANIENSLPYLISHYNNVSEIITTDRPVQMSMTQLNSLYSVAPSMLIYFINKIEINDTAVNIENGLSQLQFFGIGSIYAADAPVSLTVAQLAADLGSSALLFLNKIVGGFQIVDTAANIENGFATISEAIALSSESGSLGGLVSIQATDAPISVSAADFNSWMANSGMLFLVSGGVTISDTSAYLQGLTAAEIAGFGNDNVSTLNAVDGSIQYSADQSAAIVAAGLQITAPANDFAEETFANGSSILYSFGSTGALAEFGAGDIIDFEAVTYSAGDYVTYSHSGTAGTVMIMSSSGATVASFTVSGAYNATNFSLGADASNHIAVTYATGHSISVPDDFNGDGASDLLWKNKSTGEIDLWAMSGNQAGAGSGYVASLDPSAWRPLSTGDFNGDGKSDVLWQDTSGNLYEWLMNGTQATSSAYVGTMPSSQYTLLATDDFNGDGKADLVWQDKSTGAITIWDMNGAQVSGGGYVATLDPNTWQLIAHGDFNGDGKADLLWENKTTGDLYLWDMNNTAVTSGTYVGTVSPSQWSLVASGDFNGDGKTDLLWQDKSTGNLFSWDMNNAQVIGGGYVATMNPAQWSVASTGDFNGDGKTDLMWQDTSGNLVEWTINDTHVTGGGYVGTMSGTQWSMVSH